MPLSSTSLPGSTTRCFPDSVVIPCLIPRCIMSEPERVEDSERRSTAVEQPLIVVSNRLPVSIDVSGSKWHIQKSSGGLVSALAGVERGRDFHWVGWPGSQLPAGLEQDVLASLAADGMIAISLTEEEEEKFYQGMCNEVLWPLFHYFSDKVTFCQEAWENYIEVNRRFAEAVLDVVEPDSRVWVHDYHLMLVPELLRRARPDLEIGFFLHIPWPSSELYRSLPPRRDLLHGLLGADYIAFHTNDYAMHFRNSCMRVLGLDSDPDGIQVDGRSVRIGRHPVGIDAESFRQILARPETAEHGKELRERYDGRKLLLGIERLDYSKGIPLKLQAYAALLERRPELARHTTLLQVIIPSRVGTPGYDELRAEIEQLVTRINGRFGDPGFNPVDYVYRSLAPEELVALYQVADVALVTPIRDGMNLIAQEFVYCQKGCSGMLVLSEFAGSSHPLGDALIVNPWNVEKTGRAIERALEMPRAERDERMDPMVERVEKMNCVVWASSFLDRLGAVTDRRREDQDSRRTLTPVAAAELGAKFRAASRRILIIDYDGTLVELTRRPDQAAPTDDVLRLVETLGSLPDTEFHLVSGRPTEMLDAWIDERNIHIAAEHGTMVRTPGHDWEPLAEFSDDWKSAVRDTLSEVTREVLGSRVEEKRHAIAWHYREADPEYGLWAASGLIMRLETDVQHLGLEIVHGHRVVEVRPIGVNKGRYVRQITERLPADSFVLCIGDDRTDLDMYSALPDHAVSIHVGSPAENAAWTIDSPADVRKLLWRLVGENPIAAV